MRYEDGLIFESIRDFGSLSLGRFGTRSGLDIGSRVNEDEI
jgi:hypothetical protein